MKQKKAASFLRAARPSVAAPPLLMASSA